MDRMVRMTLEEIRASKPAVDQAKLDRTTEEDIRRYQIEDGYDPDYEPRQMRLVVPAREVRRKLGLTQEAFAAALQIPLATLRNWEQGRTLPDPAARALLTIVAKEPEIALRALKVA